MTISSRALAAGLFGLFGLLSISAASAADLYVDVPVAAPVIIDDADQWDGPYIGVFGGHQWGTADITGEGGGLYDASGWLAGVNIGYDVTVGGGLVLGVVADAAWSNIYTPDYNTFTVDWLGSLRGRVGIDGGAFLPYLTAGLAVAHGKESGQDGLFLGWTAGGGIEIAATDELSFDVQYRYSDYGTSDDVYGNGFRSHQITAGLNWRF
jgi:outer membrane immunogenic protein